LLAGAWVGFNYNFLHFNSTYIGQGANTGLPIYALFMKQVYADKTLSISPSAQFNLPAPPEGLNQFNYDPSLPPDKLHQTTGTGMPAITSMWTTVRKKASLTKNHRRKKAKQKSTSPRPKRFTHHQERGDKNFQDQPCLKDDN
jgi:penicillin-binding protein 1A